MSSPRAPLGAAIAAALALLTPATSFAAAGHDDGLPFVDRRAAVDVPDRTASSRRGLDRDLGSTGVVRTDRKTGGVALVARTDALLTGPSGGSPEAVVRRYVLDHPGVFGLDADDLDGLRLKQRFTDGEGITHLRWVQVVDGIEAFDSGVIAQVTSDGRLVSVSGGAVGDPSLATTTPARSATAGLGDARAATGGSGLAPATRASSSRRAEFVTGEQVQLRWIATPRGERLVWHAFVADADGVGYDVLTDASTGELVRRQSVTHRLVSATSYRKDPRTAATTEDLPDVWFGDSAGGTRLWGLYARTYGDPQAADPAPGNEGANTGGVFQIPATSASPLAWTPSITLGSCPGACTTWDGASPPTLGGTQASRAPAGVATHVATSRFLDYLTGAPVGFTAASGGFSSADATGPDYVRAEIHDNALGASPDLNNANFSTPPDGTPPRMQMYLFNPPATDSAFDVSVVYHEITHGLSNRLVVNAAGASVLSSFQGRMMGEAWSDFYAYAMMDRDGQLDDTPAVGDQTLGDWVVGDTAGIRAKPVDCPVNPSNAITACNGTFGAAVTGGYTYGDLAGTNNSSPHNGGEVWAQTLWDIKGVVGWDEALTLATGGMRLAPPSPSMLDLRDAMLRYAVAIRSAPGAPDDRYDELWTAFAARGFGAGASTPTSNSTTPTESYAMPDDAILGTRTLSDPYPGGDDDGFFEPGEVVRVDQDVWARRIGGVTDLAATLTTSAPADVELVDPTSAFGPLASGEEATTSPDRLVVKLSDQLACETGAPVTVTIDSSDTAAQQQTFAVGGPRSGPGGDLADGLDAEVPGAATEFTWTAQGTGTVADVDVRIDELRHTYLGDLVIQLIHDGTTVTLMNRLDGGNWSNDDAIGLVYDDEAAAGVGATGVTPLTGRFKPASPLSAFDGKDLAGPWTLRIRDFYNGDSGSLVAWGLDGNGQTTCRLEIPAAATGDATGVTATDATVGGSVTPNGRATGLRIAYGPTSSYGSTTDVVDVGAGDAAEARTTALGGLQPSTTYHYRVEAIREGKVAIAGEDRTFTTPAAAVTPPPPPPTTTTTTTPPPVTPPKATLALPRLLTLSRSGRLTLALASTPRARATIRLTYGRRTLLSKTATVPSNGRLTLRTTLSRSLRRALRGKSRVRLVYSVTIRGERLSRTVTLKVPKGLRR